MSNRTLSVLIVLVIISSAVLMFMNMFDIHTGPLENRFLTHDNVKAVEVYSQDTPHPLSFEQQRKFVDIINEAVHTNFEEKLDVVKGPFKYEKIVIIQFEGPEVTATPYGFVNTQLLMTIPEWNPDGLIRETGPGELNKIFSDAVSQ